MRETSRLLRLSRNTVRRILRGGERHEAELAPAQLDRLREAFQAARGNVVRARELLAEEPQLAVPYSTLTRWVRQAGLRPAPVRSGEYHFLPGEEMQHDTSPHRVKVGGKMLVAQCAGLVLACSRRLYIQYYPRYTRFEAKVFLLEATRFMDGTCARCVIDNTSVIVASGSGANALMAPEIAAFAAGLGFAFLAHEIGDADRKGRIEKTFSWVERNFLPGREFADFADVNAQALAWCRQVANAKQRRMLGMSAEAAYLVEKPHLQALPAVLPPVYEILDRVVDLYGFVSVDTNRYSVPEALVCKLVSVYKYPDRIQIHHRGRSVADHPRLIGERDARSRLPGHHQIPQRAPRSPLLQAQLSQNTPEVLAYARALQQRGHGRGTRALARLLDLQRTYPREAFEAAVRQAAHFGLYDLGRLEKLILQHVAGAFFNLSDGHNDDA